MQKENIMGTQPIRKLLPSMAFPIMLSMLVQAMYNIVDSLFVARYSNDALTAVSLAFPVQSLMISVAVGTGVGINALLSRRLGEQNREEAQNVTNNGVFITLISWAVFAVFGLIFSGIFMRACGASGAVEAQGTLYLRVCTIFSVGLFMQITIERLLQVTGNTLYQMISQMTGAIINIILDPILIFGYFGMPEMGVVGAAVATVIGQLCGMAVGLYINKTRNHEVQINLRNFAPDKRVIKGIYAVGLPSIIMQSIGSVMVFGMNRILIGFSEVAVSVFGIYFKLQSFVFMPVFGINNALVPIVGYNYGAQNKKRILDCIKLAMMMAVSIMALGTLVFQLFPAQLLNLFGGEAEMLSIGVPALRTISLNFCFAGVAIVFSNSFQALGNGVYSLIMSIVRQLAVLLPCAWLLANFVGLDAVWFAFLISEVFSLILAIYFALRLNRQKLSKMS